MAPPQRKALAGRFPPDFNFGEKPHPDPPDYTDIRYWAAHPAKPECGANDIVAADDSAPAAEILLPRQDRPCDAFYLTGTTFWANKERYNQLCPPQEGEHKETLVDTIQCVSALNNCCRIWAPFYRQNCPPLHNQMMHPDHPAEWQRAAYGSMDLAYSDVEHAFESFVAETTRRGVGPIIVASFSQGSHHLTRLLEKFEADEALRNRLVCAYVLGPCGTFAYDKFARCFPSLRPCSGPLDSQCVVAFDDCSEKAAMVVRMEEKPGELLECDTFPARNFSNPNDVPHNVRYPEGGGTWTCSAGKVVFCTNPLTWTSWVGEGDAGAMNSADGSNLSREELAAAYRGRCVMTRDDDGGVSLKKDVATVGKYWAEIRFNGGAVVSTQLDGEGEYGHGEWKRWYFHIRENAAARVEHFLRE